MTTITIEKTIDLKQKKFVDFNQLFVYLLKQKIFCYTDVGITEMPQIKPVIENSWYHKNGILKKENKKVPLKNHIAEIDALISKRKKCLK